MSSEITFIGTVLILFILLLIVKISEPPVKKKRPKLLHFLYKIVYADTKGNKYESRILKSNIYMLSGKPDFVMKNKLTGRLVPVELKSGKACDESEPRFNELMQLVVYFLLLEEEFGKRPKYGKLIYSDCMFIIRNTLKLRRQLGGILEDMNDMLRTGTGQAEPSFIKCRYCICRGTVCEFCEN